MPSYLLPATLPLSSELVGHTEPRGVINALHRMASWRGINVLGAWRSADVRGRASKIVPIAAVRSALSREGLKADSFEIRRAEDIAATFEAFKGRSARTHVPRLGRSGRADPRTHGRQLIALAAHAIRAEEFAQTRMASRGGNNATDLSLYLFRRARED